MTTAGLLQTTAANSGAEAAGRSAAVSRVTGVQSVSARAMSPVVGNAVERQATKGTRVAPQVQKGEPEPEVTRKNDPNTERIMRLIYSRINRERSVATMRLDPPELGRIKLQMDLRGEQLSLRIDTETSAARHLLGEQMNALRQNLEQAGIRLEQFELRAPEQSDSGSQANLGAQADDTAQQFGNAARQGTAAPEGKGRHGMDTVSTDEAKEADDAGAREVAAAESLVNIWA
jgi:flagellar hook-length control protein FliK